MYYSSWPLTGRHATRPPLLQPDPELRESDVVVDYQDALASGDVEAIVAVFEPGAYAREPAGGRYIHRGQDGLRAFYEQLFSNGGGIPLEHCAVIDDARACALEYNVVRARRERRCPVWQPEPALLHPSDDEAAPTSSRCSCMRRPKGESDLFPRGLVQRLACLLPAVKVIAALALSGQQP